MQSLNPTATVRRSLNLLFGVPGVTALRTAATGGPVHRRLSLCNPAITRAQYVRADRGRL